MSLILRQVSIAIWSPSHDNPHLIVQLNDIDLYIVFG